MPPQNPNQSNQQVEARNPLEVMQPGEQVIFELKRHPIGILIIYAMTGIVLALLAVAVFGIAPNAVSSSNKNQILTVGGLGYAFFALLCLIFNWIATVVYWGNRWILTDDSLTQVTQTGLFHKETSSLGLISLEDVTAEQNGILSKLFNYGVLKAETAGHRSKFVFTYCPNPTYYAQKILEAREREILKHHGHLPQSEHYSPESSAAATSPASQPAPSAAYNPPSDPTNPPPANSGGFNSNY
jgi:uncharacterized membrane protein YdbT with pleckstrin-like domain